MRNPTRRTALLDAAVEVLAAEGARGLTFRRIDHRAGVPAGTASNYFPDRSVLLGQVGEHIFERLRPDPERVTGILGGPASRGQELDLMHDLMARVRADRAGYLAFLELRLEATRRPEIRAALTATVRADLEAGTALHLGAGLPGDETTVLVLYLAMTGLILESLTIPDVLGPSSIEAVTTSVVEAIVPDRRAPGRRRVSGART
ncbi:MAG: TetR/AcrR family transcriptional regulator [Acidimicrobiia bacterium]